MSEDRTNPPDEQTKLLREIRDILEEQTKLVDQQWAENKVMWDANRRVSIRSSIVCVASLFGLLLLAMFLGR